MKKPKHINDILVQGSTWGPEMISDMKESENDYLNGQYNAIKSMTPKQVIKLCDADGRFYLNNQHGKVLKVSIGEDVLKFKKYVKKYSLYNK
jgi:hypothetical protein